MESRFYLFFTKKNFKKFFCNNFGKGRSITQTPQKKIKNLKGGSNAFQLMWRNLIRVAAIGLVGNFIVIIGKWFVTLMTVLSALAFFKYHEDFKDSNQALALFVKKKKKIKKSFFFFSIFFNNVHTKIY